MRAKRTREEEGVAGPFGVVNHHHRRGEEKKVPNQLLIACLLMYVLTCRTLRREAGQNKIGQVVKRRGLG